MELRKHNCESIAFRTEIAIDPTAWKKLISFFAKSEKERQEQRKAQLLRSILYEREGGVDYHYHFLARRFLRRKSQMLSLEVSMHPNIGKTERKKKPRQILEIPIAPIDQWISDWLPRSLRRKKVRLAWRASFVYDTSQFQPVFELPFKSSLTIPRPSNDGGVSVSGLKLEFQRQDWGSTTVYMEAFPKFLAITMVLVQRVLIREKLIETFLIGAEKTAKLFIKRKYIQSHEHRDTQS